MRTPKHEEKRLHLIPTMTVMLLMSGAGNGTAYSDDWRRIFFLPAAASQILGDC